MTVGRPHGSAATPGRWPAVVLAGGLLLAFAVVGWPWLHGLVIVPVTTATWLFLRLSVLRVNQAIYWWILACAVPPLAIWMLRRRARPAAWRAQATGAVRPHPVETWRLLVQDRAAGSITASIGWNDFVQLVVSLRAMERHVSADHVLHDALRDGREPLPPEVHAFLFPAAPAPPRGALARLAWRAARPWLEATRELSGRARAERLRAMSHLFSFLEDSLEMPRHDEHDRPHP